jgi:hypothetical protein
MRLHAEAISRILPQPGIAGELMIELEELLSCAADEIAGLREENRQLKREMEDASPRF